MTDLLAQQDWRSVRQSQLAICALDTPAVHFPWLDGTARAALRGRIDKFVTEPFVPREHAGCERFARDAPHGSILVVPRSNHFVFLVSPEQTYIAMRGWLEKQHP